MATALHLHPSMFQAAIEQLAGDDRFRAYNEQIRQMREAAIMDLCNDAVVDSPTKMAAAIGEIRTYSSILSLTEEAIRKTTASEI